MSYDEMTDVEKQAEAQSWKQWKSPETWGNTDSGAHTHGFVAGMSYVRETLAAANATIAALTERAEEAEKWAKSWKNYHDCQLRLKRDLSSRYGEALRTIAARDAELAALTNDRDDAIRAEQCVDALEAQLATRNAQLAEALVALAGMVNVFVQTHGVSWMEQRADEPDDYRIAFVTEIGPVRTAVKAWQSRAALARTPEAGGE